MGPCGIESERLMEISLTDGHGARDIAQNARRLTPRRDIVWFHDIAPRGRDNVAASDDIARCAHDIVRQLTILRCRRMISCNRSISRLAHDTAHTHDIVSAARYRTPVPILRAGSRYHTGTISCAHQRYRAIPAISCPGASVQRQRTFRSRNA